MVTKDRRSKTGKRISLLGRQGPNPRPGANKTEAKHHSENSTFLACLQPHAMQPPGQATYVREHVVTPMPPAHEARWRVRAGQEPMVLLL